MKAMDKEVSLVYDYLSCIASSFALFPRCFYALLGLEPGGS